MKSEKSWVYTLDDKFLEKQFLSACFGLFMLAVYWMVALTDLETSKVSLELLTWNQATAFCAAASVGIGMFFYFSLFMFLRIDPFAPLAWILNGLDRIGFVVELILMAIIRLIVKQMKKRTLVRPAKQLPPVTSPWKIVK